MGGINLYLEFLPASLLHRASKQKEPRDIIETFPS